MTNNDEQCQRAALGALSTLNTTSVENCLLPIQQARMFANQGITIDDYRGKYNQDQE